MEWCRAIGKRSVIDQERKRLAGFSGFDIVVAREFCDFRFGWRVWILPLGRVGTCEVLTRHYPTSGLPFTISLQSPMSMVGDQVSVFTVDENNHYPSVSEYRKRFYGERLHLFFYGTIYTGEDEAYFFSSQKKFRTVYSHSCA